MKKITTIMMMVMALVAANNATLSANASEFTLEEYIESYEETGETSGIDMYTGVASAMREASKDHTDGFLVDSAEIGGGPYTTIETITFMDRETKTAKKVMLYYTYTGDLLDSFQHDPLIVVSDAIYTEEDVHWF